MGGASLFQYQAPHGPGWCGGGHLCTLGAQTQSAASPLDVLTAYGRRPAGNRSRRCPSLALCAMNASRSRSLAPAGLAEPNAQLRPVAHGSRFAGSRPCFGLRIDGRRRDSADNLVGIWRAIGAFRRVAGQVAVEECEPFASSK